MEGAAEQLVLWEPVPPAANVHMVLNVAYVEEWRFGDAGAPISMVVVSSLQDRPPDHRDVLAWRITFSWVAAYHRTFIGNWSGTLPHESDAEGRRKPFQLATWEVINSHWLASNVTPPYLDARPRHHYVVASSETIYEIAASSWRSEELGDWSYVRHDLQRRWTQWHDATRATEL